jgi:hypothetical protein
MASKRNKKAGSDMGGKKTRAKREGLKLRDLDAKKAHKIRGGALEVYLYTKGVKQG